MKTNKTNQLSTLGRLRSAVVLLLVFAGILLVAVWSAPAGTITVTSTADSGPGSLREALAGAIDGDTINFAVSGTITLTNGQLDVSNSVTILGPGPGALKVSGNNASRVFNVTGTNVTINGLTIADGQGDGYGMGIKTQGAGNSAIINNCVISNNSTTLNGGGIFNDPGVTMILSNCTVSGNSANGSGGGIYNYQGLLTVSESTVSGNSAGFGGGIVNWGEAGSATLAIHASTLSSNSATAGGGILNWGQSGQATLTIDASTFSANSAGSSGGGIDNNGWFGNALLNINASTFHGNSAGALGGGIFNDVSSGVAVVELGDTILNAGAAGVNIWNGEGTVTSAGYNLSSDDGGGFLTGTGDQTNTNPLLGPLQNNGGPTWTHALLPGSPAIDKGKRDAVTNLVGTADQRGSTRPVEFFSLPNAAGGDGSDIGAFEFQKSQPPTVTTTADSGPGTLREALASAANGDTITFAASGTITLTNGQLNVPNSVTILGPGPLTVSGNHASRVFNVTGTNVTISGLTISNGYTSLNGAGINAGGGGGSSLSLNNCVVVSNYSTSSGGGGGIYLSPGVIMTVSNCTLSGNSAAVGNGGGIYNQDGVLTVVASTLSGNLGGVGGGIANDGGSGGNATLTLNASTVSSNSASFGGGGILNWGQNGRAALTINASTFSGNSAGGSGGGGIFNNNSGGTGTVEIADTILNAGAAGGNIYNYSGMVTSDGYNLCSDGGAGFLTATGDQINTNPLLGPLQNNGGPTWTHALLPGSPALDKGKTNAVPGLAHSTDQRGLARLVDNPYLANATGGDGSDIGACEFEGTGGYDTDADGLPDFWELAQFGQCAYGGTDDFDQDGQNNLFEYVAGLNPTDPASVFSVRVEMVAGQPNQRTIVFQPWTAGRTYTPLFTTDLGGAFAPLTGYSGPTTNGTEVSFTDLNATESQKFYRLQILLP